MKARAIWTLTLLLFTQNGWGSAAAELSGAANEAPPPVPTPTPQPAAAKVPFATSLSDLKFGDEAVNSQSNPRAVTVSSTGATEDRVSAAVSPAEGPFSVTPANCQMTAAKACEFAVRFSPRRTGPMNGTLTLTDTARQTASVTLTGQAVACDLTSPCGSHTAFWLLLAIVVIYEVALIAVRWNMVARPTGSLLSAQIESLQSQIDGLIVRTPNKAAQIKPVADLLAKAREQAAQSGMASWLDVLFWSRGDEISGWGLAHEAEAHLAPFLSADETRASLERAAADLLQLADSTAISIAEHIKQSLAAPVASVGDGSDERRQALLMQARGMLYDAMDTKFATLVSWQNKTAWLVGVGLVLIIALAAVLQHENLFLLGAAGGLLSRLSRTLNRADVPTDYGASWTTLFLSPVVGALSGWCGILLIAAAVKLNVLGAAFDTVGWCDTCSPMVLGLAFLLGFSERAFDEILTQLEGKVAPATKAPSATVPPLSAPVPLKIVTSKLPSAKVGAVPPYNASLQAQGGTPPYQWAILMGALPTGMNLVNGGITGNPAAAVPASFTVQVTDAVGSSAVCALTIDVAPA